MRPVVIAASMMLGLLAAPVLAVTTTTTVTLIGTINSGHDPMGIFTLWGTNLAGKSFSASYTFASDLDSSSGQAAGVDRMDIGSGATTASFSLTINNHTFTAGANSSGMVRSVDGLSGPADEASDELQLAAVNTDGARVFNMSASIASTLHDMLSDTHSVNAVPSFAYLTQAGDNATGQFFYVQSPGSPSVLSYGSFNISQISVSSTPELANAPLPVPEPGEWAMIAAGLGLVAFTANRRRAA